MFSITFYSFLSLKLFSKLVFHEEIVFSNCDIILNAYKSFEGYMVIKKKRVTFFPFFYF